MFGRYRCTVLLVALAGMICASPTGERDEVTGSGSIVGVATNVLAANVLRAHANDNANFVFSPLGFSSILAILAEGARGDTAKLIGTALRHPDDRQVVRAAYCSAIGRLQGDSALQAPQFKTWLYIYRNNSVRSDYQEVLREHYHVDVRNINRDDSVGWADVDDNGNASTSSDATDAPAEQTVNALRSTIAIGGGADGDNSKDIPEFDTLKVNGQNEDDATRLIDDQQDASKFDEVVEDKQYVEVPVIRDEIAAQKQKPDEASNKKLVNADKQLIVNENSQNSEQIAQSLEEAKESITQSTSARNNAEESWEIMEAQASTTGRWNFGRNFGVHGSGDVASAISGNSIVGRKSKEADEYESKLILFNGLYYRGSWAAPFQQLRSDAGSNVFYKSDTDKSTVHMMRARGNYKYAVLDDSKAQAIELPYDNSRYALLIIVPNSRSGLSSLQSKLDVDSIHTVSSLLRQQAIDLSLPKFTVDTTGGIEAILKDRKTTDLESIFTDQADFSGISDEHRLHIEELQQHVAVRIDEGASSENVLSATNAQRASNAPIDAASFSNASEIPAVTIDRPFLFFVRDIVDDVIIVAGKIVEPPVNDGPSVEALLD